MHLKLMLLFVAAALGLPASPSRAADALDSLQGEWTVKKSRDGESFSQVLETPRTSSSSR